MLNRMLKDDCKRMTNIGDHVCAQLDIYEANQRVGRWVIHTGQKIIVLGLKIIMRG